MATGIGHDGEGYEITRGKSYDFSGINYFKKAGANNYSTNLSQGRNIEYLPQKKY